MTTKAKLLASAALAITLVAGYAQTTKTEAAALPPPSAFDQFVKDAKNPAPWLNWGMDIRVRDEYYNNIVTLGNDLPRHEQNVIRFRGRLWASATLMTNLTLNARFSAEPREWTKPAFPRAYVGESGMEWRYGIFDNLNASWKYIMDEPLTVTVGRQDILIGDYYDWWLVADGTPGDGSWTFFLDSARLTYEMKDIKTKMDLIYIYQNPYASAWLPTVDNSSDYPITDQREQGAIAYFSTKAVNNMQIDPYFMYKHDDRVTFAVGDTPDYTSGDNADIYTVGAKITGTPAAHLFYSVEGAYQFGAKNDRILGVYETREINAYGGKAKLSYLVKDKLNNQISLAGEILSGDDPDTTDTDEMFDLLWGRWPRWSELYIYPYATETSGRIAQINNLLRFGPSWSIDPIKKVNFTAMYNALFALEETPTRATNPSRFTNDGTFRGHYLQTILKYQVTKQVSTHLWTEFVWQGDYYTKRDLESFLRAEVMFTF